jgi:hypothetical protein
MKKIKENEVSKMDEETYEKIKKDLPPQLIKDIEIYGLENFGFEILDSASSQEELDEQQKKYIKKYNSLEPHGYNIKDD